MGRIYHLTTRVIAHNEQFTSSQRAISEQRATQSQTTPRVTSILPLCQCFLALLLCSCSALCLYPFIVS
jgi:hypothetical protein